MSVIRLDVSDVENLSKRIGNIRAQVEESLQKVNHIAASIDMKVRIRSDIDNELLQVKKELTRQRDFLANCEQLITEAVNGFVDAEKIDHLPAHNFTVKTGKSSYNSAASDLAIDSSISRVADLSNMFSGGILSTTSDLKMSKSDSFSQAVVSEMADIIK